MSATIRGNRTTKQILGSLLIAALAAAIYGISAAPASAAECELEPRADCYGFETASVQLSTAQAGAHPDMTIGFAFEQDPTAPVSEGSGARFPYGKLKNLTVNLPPGLIGNPTEIPQCTVAELWASVPIGEGKGAGAGSPCPQTAQIGISSVSLEELSGGDKHETRDPVFMMKPPGGDVVARIGFVAQVIPVVVDISLRSDYGLSAKVVDAPATATLVRSSTTLWGVPAASSHDRERITTEEGNEHIDETDPRESGLTPTPFITNPTSCGGERAVTLEAESYQAPGHVAKAVAPLPPITGCQLLGFQPSLSIKPTTSAAASPSGLDADLAIPQDESPEGLATSTLRDTEVVLPKGMTIAAGAADGLEACSAGQVGYEEEPPAQSHCPSASKIGEAEIDSPPLEHLLQGAVYQRSPAPGELVRIWLVADELGVHLKIPGEVHLNPSDGQITSLFLDTPPLPVREFKLHFKGGSRGPIATPSTCGVYRTAYRFTPWSGNADARGETPMTIDANCGAGGFSPKLSAGATDPTAGSFSHFALNLTQESGEQNLSGLDVHMPPGVLAKLAGVALCQGAAATSGECPSASQVGTATVATGPGTAPLWIPQPGKSPTAVYLSGPYKGGPYSLVVKVPAQAGPFDLGTVVTRAAIYVDPRTAEVSVVSDPLPQFLEGVPTTYRTVHVDVDRPEFTINPTDCEPMSVGAVATSIDGARANPTSRFQVGDCAALEFRPHMTVRLKGGTRRTAHPELIATVYSKGLGVANLARTQVTLPRTSFLDQAHIRTICTRVQFAAGAGNGANCPRGSVYGHAWVKTPLFDYWIGGKVYLRSSNHKLPDLVLALNGPASQPIAIELDGRTDSVHGALRNTFEAVPDAPFDIARVVLFGGKRGLVVNSRNLCAGKERANVRMIAQSGKAQQLHPMVRASCKKHKRHRGHHRRHRRG